MPIFIYLFIFKRNRFKKRDFFYLLIFGGYIWSVFDVTGIGTLSDIVYAPKGGVESFWIQYLFVQAKPFYQLGRSFMLNVVMCVPFGLLLPVLFPRYRNILKAVGMGLLFSLFIEVTQLLNTRISDVDDLIANTLGTFIGFLVWKIGINRVVQLKEGLSIHPWQVIFLGYLGQCFLYFPFWFVQHF
ncbi:hypothetical protein RR47_GL001907 [Enterococcus columbae DSM 7374 = ATCC 51263]|nr:hypothetical protein RR47_GL001907 [Enterococcus columbae DSM 7374 = ATCC 51263]